MFDLEMTNLHADYGRLICGCIKPYGEEPQIFRIDETPVGKKEPWNDRDLAVQLRDALEKYFMVYSYNGIMFDIKFLNSRLMKHGERVLEPPMHKDLLFTAKRAFALSSNRLATVQEFLDLESEKSRIDGENWNRAATGNKPAIDYIVDHCVRDVAVLEDLFDVLKPYIRDIYR